MADGDSIERRLDAVERALTDGDQAVADLEETGRLADRLETTEDELRDLRDRVEELDAATQALRGYVGNVRSVNRDVEQRADAAIAAVDRLEAQVADETATDTSERESERGPGVATETRETRNGPTARPSRERTPGRCEACGSPERRHGRARRATSDGHNRHADDRPGTSLDGVTRRDAVPEPGSSGHRDPVAEETNDETSVIERVRDALG